MCIRDSIQISADGRISASGGWAAKGQAIAVQASQGMDLSGNVAARQVSLQSQRDVVLRGGDVVADEQLSVNAGSLNDVGRSASDKAKRFGQTVSVTTTGAAAVQNATWGAQDSLTLSSGGNATLTDAQVYAKGALTANAAALALNGSTQVSATGAAHVTTSGRTDIAAGSTLQGQAMVKVTAATLGNLGTVQGQSLQVVGTLDNGSTGTVASASSLNLTGTHLGNQGKVVADTLTASTTTLTNSGTLQGRTVTLTQSGQLTNSGTVVATGSQAALSVQAGALTNSGKLASDGNTGVQASTTLQNSAGGQITGQAIGMKAAQLSNSGLVHAAQALTVGDANTQSLTNTSTGTLQGHSIDAQAGTLSNQGKVRATQALTATSRQSALQNSSGATMQGTSVMLSGGLTNAGLIKAASDTAAASQIFVRMDDLNTAWANQVGGRIESGGSIRLQGQSGTQAGTLLALNDVALGDATRALNTLNVSGSVISQSGRIDASTGAGLSLIHI